MAEIKLCLLDRDGVLNVDKAYLYKPEAVEWVEDSLKAIAWLNRKGIEVAVVTNQSGVARGYFSESDVIKLHIWMQEEVQKAGGIISAFYYCPHLQGAPVKEYDRDCNCRKPKPGMILQALHDFDVKPENAFMAGDSPRDVEAAEAAGVRGYLYHGGSLLEFMQGILKEEK